MAKGKEAGKTYLQQVLGKITDPELKAKAEAVFTNDLVATEIGNGVAGQAEIDRQLQELRTQTEGLAAREADITTRDEALTTYQQQLTDWRATRLADLQELDEFRTGKKGAPAAPGLTTKLPDNVITAERLEETIANERAAFLGFNVERDQIQREHFDKFGKFLNTEDLLKHPKIRDLGLVGVYHEVHKDALATYDQRQQDAARDKIREEERAKLLAAGAGQPYPLSAGPGTGSPLDALDAARTNNALVDQASAEYARLTTQRQTA